ncbi:MAG: hypothetical protein RBU45_05755 [Myxococcota bacterium]|nr:hypothetical protein [Myxococcota bacterium]
MSSLLVLLLSARADAPRRVDGTLLAGLLAGLLAWACLPGVGRAEPPRLTVPAEVRCEPGVTVPWTARLGDAAQAPAGFASAGTLGPLQVVGPGAVRGSWSPPAQCASGVAVIALWDDGDRTRLPALARVRLRGEAAGEAPSEVLILQPPEILGDGEQIGQVLRVGSTPAGEPWEPPSAEAGLALTTGGWLTLGEPVRLAPGLTAAAYQVPPTLVPREVEVVAWRGPEVAAATLLHVRPTTPGALTVRVLPSHLVPAADGFPPAEIEVVLTAASGRGVPDQPLTLATTHGDAGPLRSLGNGRYRAAYAPPRHPVSLPADVTVTVRLPGPADAAPAPTAEASLHLDAGPPARLQLQPRVPQVPADGRTRVPLELRVVDFLGNPVGCALRLAVDHGGLGPIQPLAGPGTLVVEYTPPGLPDLDYRVELRFTPTCDGHPLPLEGGLTLTPIVEEVPPAPADHVPAGWSWLAPPAAPGMAAPERLLLTGVGWLALVGDGLFGRARGPQGSVEFLQQVDPGAPLYVGGQAGFVRLAASTRASGPGLDPAVDPLGIQVSQNLVPLLGSLRLRWAFLPRVALSAGLALGALISWNDVAVDGLAQDLGHTSLDIYGRLPIGIEALFDDFLILVEASGSLSLSELDQVELSGVPIGLVGPRRGVAVQVSAGWRLP